MTWPCCRAVQHACAAAAAHLDELLQREEAVSIIIQQLKHARHQRVACQLRLQEQGKCTTASRLQCCNMLTRCQGCVDSMHGEQVGKHA